MGGKSAKQQAQTGTCGYWPYANLFSGLYGLENFNCGLSPFFGGCGYNWFNGYNGISPLAFPYNYGAQSITHGTLKMKNTLTKASLNYKW